MSSNTIPQKGFGDAELAAKVVEAYAEGVAGVLSKEECDELNLNSRQCGVLMGALASDGEGIITEREKKGLVEEGFSKQFIDSFSGTDGSRPIKEHVKWLSRNIRCPKYGPPCQTGVLERLGKMGQEGIYAMAGMLFSGSPDMRMWIMQIIKERVSEVTDAGEFFVLLPIIEDMRDEDPDPVCRIKAGLIYEEMLEKIQ